MAVNQYIKDTIGEMKHVSWPTRKQAVLYSILVVVISAVIASYIGVLDTFLIKLLNIFINS